MVRGIVLVLALLLCARELAALAAPLPAEIDLALKSLEQFTPAGPGRAPLRQIAQFIATTKDEPQRATAGERLAAIMRRDAAASARVAPELLKLAVEDEAESIRLASIWALGAAINEGDYPALVKLLFTVQSDVERRALRDAIAAAAGRLPAKDKAAEPLIENVHRVSGASRVAGIGALSRIGGKAALDAVRQQLKSTDMAVSEAAAKALTEWPDASAVGDMLNIASSPSASDRMLALKGLTRVLALPSSRSNAETLNIFKQMLDSASKPEEKKLVLLGLAEVMDAGALALTTALLADEAVKSEAAAATLRVAAAMSSTEKTLSRAAVERVLMSGVNGELKQRAESMLAESKG